MTIHYHPDDELLLAYACGSLDEATALLIATHATFCPRCRDGIDAAEAIGGELLDSLPPGRLDDKALGTVLQRLTDAPAAMAVPAFAAKGLPVPLHSYIEQEPGGIAWRWFAPGIRQTLLLRCGAAKLRMLRISPNRAIPHHRHGGIEYTLLLDGAYDDESGQYGVGDFMVADVETGHQPVAASQGCMCLVMSVAPIHLTGWFGRLVNPVLPY